MPSQLPPQGKDIQPNPFVIFAILVILAAGAVLGLDYLNWKKGDKSHFFSIFFTGATEIESVSASPLFDTARTLIQKHNLSQDAFSHYRDAEGFFHIMLTISSKEYSRLSQALKAAFNKLHASVSMESRSHEEEARYVLWEVQGADGEILYVLFLIRPPAPDKTESLSDQRGRVALIIDDLGYSLNSIRAICELNQKLTIAVLPHTPLARETARIARQNNLEVILHLPMESLNNHYDNEHTVGLIHSGMSKADIIASVDEGLGNVPYIRGVNTHMGSKTTQDPEVMKIILSRVKKNRLYFIDSRTASESVAFAVAREMGIPSSRRHVFLDGEVDSQYIKNQFVKLLETAARNGYAVGIGHPYPETLKTLKDHFHLIEDYGLQAVYASEIVE